MTGVDKRCRGAAPPVSWSDRRTGGRFPRLWGTFLFIKCFRGPQRKVLLNDGRESCRQRQEGGGGAISLKGVVSNKVMVYGMLCDVLG